MTKDLAAFAKEKGVKYFMISYTDLFGGQRAKLVPAQAIADMQEDGAGFAGFATWLDFTPAHPDMLAVPDPNSVIQLPWKPEVALFLKDASLESNLGNLLSDMLVTMTDRGPDSAGIAIYADKDAGRAKFTIQSDNAHKDFEDLPNYLSKHLNCSVDIRINDTHAVVTLDESVTASTFVSKGTSSQFVGQSYPIAAVR